MIYRKNTRDIKGKISHLLLLEYVVLKWRVWGLTTSTFKCACSLGTWSESMAMGTVDSLIRMSHCLSIVLKISLCSCHPVMIQRSECSLSSDRNVHSWSSSDEQKKTNPPARSQKCIKERLYFSNFPIKTACYDLAHFAAFLSLLTIRHFSYTLIIRNHVHPLGFVVLNCLYANASPST